MDDDSIIVFIFLGIFCVGAFFIGMSVGRNQWKKPCDQFTKWQYQLGQVPAKCTEGFTNKTTE